MKNILLILILLISLFGHSQINVLPYSQTFSNVAPSHFTTTADWSLTNNDKARTGSYSARLSPAINNNSNYLYIAVSVTANNTYVLSLWSLKACKIRLIANETSDQTSVLVSENNDVESCNGNAWKETKLTYKPNYTGVMYFQILVYEISEDKIYIDDISITSATSLPIELLFFNGEYINGYNKLYWSTASETDNDYFTIEKSNDGYSFYNIAFINGFGNSTSQLFYEYNDYELNGNIVYYRLSQTDYNGDLKYYKIISVDNRFKIRIIVKVINLYGSEVDINTKGVLILIFNDGSIKKIINK